MSRPSALVRRIHAWCTISYQSVYDIVRLVRVLSVLLIFIHTLSLVSASVMVHPFLPHVFYIHLCFCLCFCLPFLTHPSLYLSFMYINFLYVSEYKSAQTPPVFPILCDSPRSRPPSSTRRNSLTFRHSCIPFLSDFISPGCSS